MIDTVYLRGDPKIGSDLLRMKWLNAFHAGNAGALSDTFADDGIYITWTEPLPVKGRDAIRAAFEHYFIAFPTRQLAIRDESTHLYGDTVIYNCNWVLTYGDGKGPIKTIYGRTCSTDMIIEREKEKTIERQELYVLMASSLLPTIKP